MLRASLTFEGLLKFKSFFLTRWKNLVLIKTTGVNVLRGITGPLNTRGITIKGKQGVANPSNVERLYTNGPLSSERQTRIIHHQGLRKANG